MSKPAARGSGQHNLPEVRGGGGRETFLGGTAHQGAPRLLLAVLGVSWVLAVLGVLWVLADAVPSALLGTGLFYVGFLGVFLARRVCNCPLFFFRTESSI